MSKLEPGMLALVIGYRNIEINLGKIVTLERFVKKGEFTIRGSAARDLWIISGHGVGYMHKGRIIVGKEGLCTPESLIPIRPEADPLETKQEQELHA